MTHDELLARVQFNQGYQMGLDGYKICSALRAVVELHTPATGWEDGVEVENHHCSCDPYNEYDMGYPCDTIQAIEKELL